MRLLLTSALLLALAIGNIAHGKGELSPEPHHSQAGQVVAELLERYHYRKQSINEDISEAFYTKYFEMLDPERFYFLQTDIAEFAESRAQMGADVAAGNLDLAFEIFDRYRERVRERSAHAVALLQSELNFDSDQVLDLDRKNADWAESAAALDQIWEKRVLNDILTQKLTDRDLDTIRESLTKRYERLARNLDQYSAEDVFQTFISALSSVYDPHSSYLSPRASENFDINMSLSLEGIGALLSMEGDFVEIVELIAGGPASQSGELGSGDQIIGVGQTPDAIEDVVGWRLGDVVDLIRGPKGSEVTLEIITSAGSTGGGSRLVTLERNTIELEEQAAKADVIEVEQGDKTHRIGVVQLPTFYTDFAAASAGEEDYRSTTRDVAALLSDGKLSGIDGLVIDLRGNSGGSLDEAVKLTGLFIDEGPVVQVRRSNGQKEVLRDPDTNGTLFDGPLGVLVDSNSASASEIFAAAIQDYGRGVVMGAQTFGKGTVQTLIGLDRFGVTNSDDMAGRLKLTIAKFYRINGDSTQLEGVTPDILLPYPELPNMANERDAENALPWNTIESTPYHELSNLESLVGELEARHKERLNSKPALKSASMEAARLRQESQDTVVSLNEEKRRAQIKQQETARLEAINEQLAAYGLEPIESLDDLDRDAVPDVLRDEAAAIIADLAVLQAKNDLQPTVADHALGSD
ncbi:peptidase S41 [Spiribacter sp. C176]|uniref:Peptidase S41 n=1 Tax=Spiribacter salilacus TaxID=2664894 RepID=A0A6N7QPD2_9GAMM|nr:carboxy terminal-processing peptidase [Spiribacter salilacus]MRH77243.1 peptidase S41 [Spiribacter salilacus]